MSTLCILRICDNPRVHGHAPNEMQPKGYRKRSAVPLAENKYKQLLKQLLQAEVLRCTGNVEVKWYHKSRLYRDAAFIAVLAGQQATPIQLKLGECACRMCMGCTGAWLLSHSQAKCAVPVTAGGCRRPVCGCAGRVNSTCAHD